MHVLELLTAGKKKFIRKRCDKKSEQTLETETCMKYNLKAKSS